MTRDRWQVEKIDVESCAVDSKNLTGEGGCKSEEEFEERETACGISSAPLRGPRHITLEGAFELCK